MKIIVDPGSCHMAKLEYCKEAIDLAYDTGCWAIKFQLFKNRPPNIELPREYWGELVEYAKDRIIIFASVFDPQAIKLLSKYETPYIKIPFSKRKSFSVMDKTLFVSCHPSEVHKYRNCIKLFCIPEYPVLYKIDFNVLQQYGFDGFSDHTVGYEQTLHAVEYGAKYIEKHITLDHPDIDCPDNLFALKPKELKELMKCVKTK